MDRWQNRGHGRTSKREASLLLHSAPAASSAIHRRAAAALCGGWLQRAQRGPGASARAAGMRSTQQSCTQQQRAVRTSRL